MNDTDDRGSTMPLRVFGPIGPYKGPKPMGLIRYFLKRIQLNQRR